MLNLRLHDLLSAATVCAAAVIVLRISSEEKQHISIIYSMTAQLRLYNGGSFTAVGISEVGVYLEENNSHLNLLKMEDSSPAVSKS